MTENEAIKMLKAKLTCMKLEALSCIEKGCDKDCEYCEYNYAQGNMGEQKEALDIAIQSLEEIQQYRAIGTVKEIKTQEESTRRLEEAYLMELATLREYREIGTLEECREAAADAFINFIVQAPSEAVVPAVHGEWIYENYTWHCGRCLFHPFKGYIPNEPGFNLCPNCGADMRKGGAE